MSWRVVDVMSEMWPEAADGLESFEGLSAGLNAPRGAAHTRAVLWVTRTFIAVGREKPGIGHRVVVERFAVSEIVGVVDEEVAADGADPAPPRTSGTRPPGRFMGRGRRPGRLVIRTRRGDIDFTAGTRHRDRALRAYVAIADLTGRR